MSTFVGASVQDLLKHGGKVVTGGSEGPSTPPSPPPPPPPPTVVPMTDNSKATNINRKPVNGEHQDSLPCSEMLPGPPPVPPVYGDNDSSETDSPSENNNRKTSDSPTLPRPPPFPSLSVVPIPPPPSVVPDIAVPPPPPPPPKNGSTCSTALVKPPEPVAQSYIAPPPPPPSLYGSAPSALPPVPPPPLGTYPPVSGMIPFAPPFINGPLPPPPVPTMTFPSPATTSALRPAPVPAVGIPASSPMINPVRPSGFPNQGQIPVPHVGHREFFPCSFTSRPGFSHGPLIQYPAQSNLARMDIPKGRPGATSESLPASYGSTKCSGTASTSTIPSTFGNRASLPSQLQSTSGTTKGALPADTASGASRVPTDKKLVPKTPTPPPSPPIQQSTDKSRLTGKNGPRTPSPDISKKHVYNSEIERLKRDIEEEKRRVELQTKLDLLELKFQAKLREKAAQSSSSKEDISIPWHTSTHESATTSKEGIAKGCANDSDSMDVDGADSEEERGDAIECGKTSGSDSQLSQSRKAATNVPQGGFGVGRGQSFNYVGGRAFLPQLGPQRNFIAASSTTPPNSGRFGSVNTSGSADRSRGGFFQPPMRGVIRGAPNLRRGFPGTGGFRSPMTSQPFRGRGGFYGPRRFGPRGGV
ncbi:hypothetical protein KIN20_029349 [Parelaphostrongylus tenuis]|uniref:Uncharacterized protein n=1 Tax=Parelaphostrongylus tenuis TaxID=148309 RepID=A0AAD5WFX4_PARTN|nr:hypothetical protein KIN20_029349 [Parelaphostrongylus tenuis]